VDNMSPPGPVEPAELLKGSQGEAGKPASPFYFAFFAQRLQEPDMLQDIPTPDIARGE